MSKQERPAKDASVSIGQDANSNVIVTGDGNVVHISREGCASKGDNGKTSVPKVFISSTSEDLKLHREAARDAALAASFLPVSMEYFVASSAHAPLAACMEKVDGTDVTVVIVAHRYGWIPPDQDEDERKSITWLECERTLANDKELLAFVVAPEHPWDDRLKEEHLMTAAVLKGEATPELLEEVQTRVTRLQEFKSWINSLGIRLTFTTPEDLRGKVSDELRKWKERHRKPASKPEMKRGIPRTEESPSQPPIPQSYRDWLQQKCGDMELPIGRKEGQSIRLNHVYVPLATNVTGDQNQDEMREPRKIAREERESPDLLLEQLDQQSLYVPGDPGTGKSTFCRWVAWLVAARSLPDCNVPAPEGFEEPFPTSLRERLPLLIRLRDMWNYLPQDEGRARLSPRELESALSNWLDSGSFGGLSWEIVSAHLQHGSTLLIIDGVDEVPLRVGEGNARCYPRAMLLAGLSEAAAEWQQAGNRLLVTSRPYGLDKGQAAELPLQTAPIRELDSQLQQLLVRRWFHVLKRDSEQAAEMASDMLQHLSERQELSQLTANPMLLTSMCVIYEEGKRLPQDKHDLYGRIVDNVLHNRYRHDPAELEMAREHLCVIACGMHTGQGLNQERDTPQAEVSHRDMERMIQAYHEQSSVTFSGYQNALKTRDELLQRSGLLLSRGETDAGFYHYTFQDFLAARRLADIDRDRLFELFTARADSAEWRSTLSFLFGSELANSREQATRLLTRIVDALTVETTGLAVVAADCFETMLGRDNRLREDVEEKFRQICLAAIDYEVEIKSRHTLGLALGRLGDARVMTDLRDPAAYVELPAGVYAWQDGQQNIKQPFLLAKFPVTNSQYGLFVDEEGYRDRNHWSEAGWQWKEQNDVSVPEYWQDGRRNGANQPVVGVSWYEADAFCRWAGGFLPTEQQWEAAARGEAGREYPWDGEWQDGICNSSGAGLGITSTVGLFPRSRTEQTGLEDLAGNVWEWCDSWSSDSKKYRVLRGGSFYTDAHDVRSAFRLNLPPDYRIHSSGFRVARTYR